MMSEDTALPGVRILTPRRHADARGVFCETFSRDALRAAGVDIDFVQDNQSRSPAKGTVRGLHFQAPPFAQDKLVRVLRGAILDVAIDLRRASPTFGRHVGIELSAANWRQLLVPMGFAHGFCTLEPDTEVFYKVSNVYSAAHDRGVKWDDPALAIRWPVDASQAIVSEKDRAQPTLSELGSFF